MAELLAGSRNLQHHSAALAWKTRAGEGEGEKTGEDRCGLFPQPAEAAERTQIHS